MGTIKERNGMDLTEAKDIKKRRQDTKKDHQDPDDHNSVITHLSQTSWNVKSSGP